MKAIATIAANPPDWAPVTLGRMREYADRTGVEFVVCEPKEWRGMMDRQLLREVVASYDQTLLLDLDVVVSRTAPPLLEECTDDAVWMTRDAKPGDVNCRSRRRAMIGIQATRGAIRWVSGYGNAGVVVASRAHADAWTNWISVPVTLCEQTTLNYRIRQLGMGVGWLHRNWNSMGINNGLPNCLDSCESIARDAFFAHAAGFSKETRKAAILAFDEALP